MKEYYRQGLEIRGGRRMICEQRRDLKGHVYPIEVPVELLPLERTILSILAFSQNEGITGGTISRKIMPEKKKSPSKIHKTLTRLKSWGYLNWKKEESDEEVDRRINLNFITQRGIKRIIKDYEN